MIPRGTILFWIETDDRAFGFIAPNDGEGRREMNVWFGLKALKGWIERPRSGDRVAYTAGIFRKGKGPSAERVTRCNADDDEGRATITTIPGQDDI